MDKKTKLKLIFQSANCFYECAKRVLGIKNEDESIKIIENSNILGFLIPFCVNISFACELYLKMLLLCIDIKARGHNLFVLYDKLPTKQQKEIILHPCMNKKNKLYNEIKNDFMASLNISSEIFVKYRYKFDYDEVPNAKLLFLLNLAECLKDICSNKIKCT